MTQQKADYPLDYSKGAEDTTKDRLRDLADTTTDQVKHVAENAQEFAGKVAEQAQDAVKNFKPFVEKSLKEQPMATLAAAAAIAFVLGALWKR